MMAVFSSMATSLSEIRDMGPVLPGTANWADIARPILRLLFGLKSEEVYGTK